MAETEELAVLKEVTQRLEQADRVALSWGETVKDTSPRMERKFRNMLLERSGEERLKMGCSMHATSQALVKGSVLEKNPNASPAILKRSLFLYFYGHEFGPKKRNKIILALKKNARPSGQGRCSGPKK